MTPAIRLTDDDDELLSAYVDGELSEPERTRLEARLGSEPALRAALDDLRATVQILRTAPQVAPPRNFTLDPARHQRRVAWWADFRSMQLIGALGAIASVLLIALGVLTTTLSPGQPALAPALVGNGVAMQTTAGATSLPTNEQQAKTLDKSKDSTQTAQSRESFAATAAPTSVALVPTMTPPPTATPQPTMAAMLPAPASPSPALALGAAAPTQTATRTSAKAGVAQSGGAGAAPPLPQPTSSSVQSNAAVSEGAQSAPQPGIAATPSRRSAAADNVAAVPTSAPLPTATQTSTVTALPTASPTITASDTEIARTATSVPQTAISAAPTLPAAATGRNAQSLIAGPQFVLIVGIVLLVFSIMLLGIAWMRSRL